MRNVRVWWVSAIALVAVAGCGSDSSGGGGGSGGSGNLPTPVIDLRVDNNRNGVIDLDDATEDEGEDTWTATNGAIFLANVDDDSYRCPKGAETASLSDAELASCYDGADDIVNGESDLLDMARMVVKPWPEAPDDASAQITLQDPAANYVRVFKNNGGNWDAVGFPLVVTPAEIRAGVELAIEGKDILRDKDAWDGMAHFQLDMDAGRAPGGGDYQDGSDSVVLRIAPLLLSHHLQKPVQTYVTDAGQFSPGSTVFRQDLKAATEAAGVPDGMSEHAVGDQWTQDWMEIGWTSMPAPNGEQHTIDVFMRSVNVESGKKLRQAGREVYAAFHGQDTAGLTPSYDPNHDGSMDSLNSYGNTETIPPYEYNGESYPMGRVFRGSVASFHPDPLMQKMLDAQAVQPILNVDTSWLLVGHVDETISFVKMDNARGWGMAVNDAAMAKKMLEDLVSQGQGGVLMFEGQKWYTDTGTEPAQVTVQDVLNDTDVMGESAKAVVEVDGQMDVFKKEVGITDADVIPVPFLHWTAYGYSVAYQPGTVNGISLGDAHFGAPKTHGPIVNGKDPFAEQLETEFGKHGITIDWIEDWDLYHRLDGEVHCGSNTKRALPENAKWWESGR